MDTLIYIFRLFALSQVATWGLYVLYFHRSRTGWLAISLFLGFMCYLVMPFADDQWNWDYLLVVSAIAANMIPAIVWLLARYFFLDTHPVPWFFYIVCAVYLVLVSMPSSVENSLIAADNIRQFIFFFIPQAVKLGLVLHVIYLAIRDRDGDLVEERLRIRAPIAIAIGIVVATVIIVEIGFNNEVPKLIDVLGSMGLFLFTLLVTLWGMRMRPELRELMQNVSMDTGNPGSPKVSTNQYRNGQPYNAPEVVDKIAQLMERERFYANENLTLDVMAQHLQLPGYRLRRTINQGMGFRNFNQFLNSYRIAEASKRLLSERHLPILSIALDIGFRSLSAFNKAFKDTHLMTPSDYRSSHKESPD